MVNMTTFSYYSIYFHFYSLKGKSKHISHTGIVINETGIWLRWKQETIGTAPSGPEGSID